MENPFELLNNRLARIENLLQNIYTKGNALDTIKVAPKILTTQSVADYLNLSTSCIYKLTSSREIPHSKRGKRLYFDKNEIDKWVMENKCVTNNDINDMANDYLMTSK
jgi:excisionase family DNA binding protein